LNDNVTVFLGGNKHSKDIVFFDWNTQTYTLSSTSLIEKR
jgi:hypothetical protein